jgi:membrane protease YdiL (CAAX protease family)
VGPFVVAFLSSAVFAGLLLSVAGRLFTSEKLVNASWEPLTMRGLGLGRGSAASRRLPAIDQAVALVSVSTLLAFYLVGPVMAKWGLAAAALATEVAFVLAPTLLFAALAHWRWRETFSLGWPRLPALAGSLAIGLGMVAWVDLLFSLQCAVWRPPDAFLRMSTELFAAPLARHPLALPIVVSVSAGVCEELLYRGPLQVSLVRRLPRGAAIAITALFFAAAHMDPYGFAVRAVIGVVLGWLVLTTRSIAAGIVAHAAYDGAKLLAAGVAVKADGVERMVEKATEARGVEWEPASLAACTALLVVGVILLRVGRPRAPAPPA